jgi:predicted DNA-binding antitoxin AbrB/MazE fold protein
MSTVRAVYENGVFRPTGPIDLPEHSLVEFEPRPVGEALREGESRHAVYEVLSRRYDGGESDVAERHDEHQP